MIPREHRVSIRLAVKLLILGGTGGTGKHVVSQALDAGHDVTVFARDPSKSTTTHQRLQVLRGDLLDRDALSAAAQGQDAVISAIGRGKSFKSERLIERTVPAIIAAMQVAAVKRLIFTSALGVGDTFADSPIVPKLFFRTLLRGIYADKLAGDQLIRSSGLEWTIVQPAVLTDGPLTRAYRSGEHLSLSGMPSVSRADTAHFILERINDRSTFSKTLILAN
jgi:putative NADH-flavin reductase